MTGHPCKKENFYVKKKGKQFIPSHTALVRWGVLDISVVRVVSCVKCWPWTKEERWYCQAQAQDIFNNLCRQAHRYDIHSSHSQSLMYNDPRCVYRGALGYTWNSKFWKSQYISNPKPPSFTAVIACIPQSLNLVPICATAKTKSKEFKSWDYVLLPLGVTYQSISALIMPITITFALICYKNYCVILKIPTWTS